MADCEYGRRLLLTAFISYHAKPPHEQTEVQAEVATDPEKTFEVLKNGVLMDRELREIRNSETTKRNSVRAGWRMSVMMMCMTSRRKKSLSIMVSFMRTTIYPQIC